MRTRRFVRNFLCGLSDSTLTVHIISQKARILENIIDHKMCVSIFSTTLHEIFLVLRRIEGDIIINVHVKCRLLYSDFSDSGTFSIDCRKNNQTPYLMEILSVGGGATCSIRKARRTDAEREMT